MAKDPPNNNLLQKLLQLETLKGTQKKAAESLGVSTRTFQRMKKGNATPSKKAAEKINRITGNVHNQKKLETTLAPKLEKKIEKFKKDSRKEVTVSARDWINSNYNKSGMGHIMKGLAGESMYVTYMSDNPGVGQFTDMFRPAGLPKGKLKVTVYGLALLNYQMEKGDGIEQSLFVKTAVAMVNHPNGADLETTLREAERQFFGKSYQIGKGRQKFNPISFIGIKIEGS